MSHSTMPWDEWSGADSWSASNAESMESSKGPFSFFNFNLFESEEKFQMGYSSSEESEDINEEMKEKPQNRVHRLVWPQEKTQVIRSEKSPASQNHTPKNFDTQKHEAFNDASSSKVKMDNAPNETHSMPKGRFLWKQGKNQHSVRNHKEISSGNVNRHPPSAINGHVRPKDLIQKHLLRFKAHDVRDDVEDNNEQTYGSQKRDAPVPSSLPLGRPKFNDWNKSAPSKKCFPHLRFKNHASSPDEFVPEPVVQQYFSTPMSTEEVRPRQVLKADRPRQGASIPSKISMMRNKTNSSVSRLYDSDTADDDIWDAWTTSSGWLSLESLDGK